MAHSHTHKPSPDERYEERDASFGGIVKFGFWITVFTAVTFVAMYGVQRGLHKVDYHGGEVRNALAPAVEIPPEPHLEVLRLNAKDHERKLMIPDPANPGQKLAPFTNSMWRDYRDKSNAELSSYGWIDRQQQIARIPIERAMELALKKGFATQSKAKTN